MVGVPETNANCKHGKVGGPISFDLRSVSKRSRGPGAPAAARFTNVSCLPRLKFPEIEIMADIDLASAPFASKTHGNVDGAVNR